MGHSDLNGNNIFTKDKGVPPEIMKAENELEARYEKYRAILEELTIMSDIFMRNVLKSQECTVFILQVIMKKKDLKVQEQVIQKDYKNLQGRSVILDCVARDTEDKLYDMEIQQENDGASPKRSRYHSGLMDMNMNMLHAGQDFDQLPESYVIFITRDDVLGDGLPIYHIRKRIDENGKAFADGACIIYVNSGIKNDDTELGRLMHDLHCKDPDKMYSKVLAKRVRELKKTPEGVTHMCEVFKKYFKDEFELAARLGMEHGMRQGMAQGIEQGIEQGIRRGTVETKKEIALSLKGAGMPVEQIAQIMKVSISVVREWLAEGVSAVK